MATTAGRTEKNASQKAAEDSARSNEAEFAAQIEVLREEVARLSEQIAKSGERSYGAARKAAAAGVGQIKEQGEAKMEELKAGAQDLEEELSRRVREKPLTALAAAAGMGFLLALLSRR